MKALLLLSGGFDSAVAGYLMKEKGVEVTALHFSLEPFTNNTPELKSKEIAEKFGFKLIVVKHGRHHEEIANKCKHRYYYVLTRRLMYRIAKKIAVQEGCDFLITGENLGQVGSQTLQNMYVIDNAVKINIIRPLLTWDKHEIIEFAKKIGTYEISKGPEMCSVLGPKHPATKAKLEVIKKEEKKIDIDKMVKDALIKYIKSCRP